MRLIAYTIVAVLVAGAGCALQAGNPGTEETAPEGAGISRYVEDPGKVPPATKGTVSETVVRDIVTADDDTANPEPSPWRPPSTTDPAASQTTTGTPSSATKAARARSDNGVHLIDHVGETEL
jgi:hypothetical protein